MIKYLGGKARLAKYICPILNKILKDKQVSGYYEPFVGGAWIAQEIMTSKPIKASDYNPYLIAMYQALQEGWIPPKAVSQQEYLDIRANPSKYDPHLVGFSGIAGSFGGKWQSGYAHDADKPNGLSKHNFVLESYNAIMRHRKSLNFKRILFSCSSYKDVQIQPDSLVYCDPPYKASINGYAYYGDGFDHEDFWKTASEWVSLGNIVMVSEYEAPFNWVPLWERVRKNTIQNTSDGLVVERLFCHRSQEGDIRRLYNV